MGRGHARQPPRQLLESAFTLIGSVVAGVGELVTAVGGTVAGVGELVTAVGGTVAGVGELVTAVGRTVTGVIRPRSYRARAPLDFR